jgi:hypothetical protein
MSQASQDFVPLAQRTKKMLKPFTKPRRKKRAPVAALNTKKEQQEGFEDLAKRTKLTIDEVGKEIR